MTTPKPDCLWGGKATPLVDTSVRLDRAQDHMWVAERALHANPRNKWLRMLVDLLRDEVETARQILAKDSQRKQSQRRRSQC
jgi:hypothetical protein